MLSVIVHALPQVIGPVDVVKDILPKRPGMPMPSIARIRIEEPQAQPLRHQRMDRHALEVLPHVVALQHIHLFHGNACQRAGQDLAAPAAASSGTSPPAPRYARWYRTDSRSEMSSRPSPPVARRQARRRPASGRCPDAAAGSGQASSRSSCEHISRTIRHPAGLHPTTPRRSSQATDSGSGPRRHAGRCRQTAKDSLP